MKKMFMAAAAATVFASTAALAIVSVDLDTGVGFVGKGDVQLVYGWNNKALQDNASSVRFRLNSETVTEVSWECTNQNNDKVQERSRTTTTSLQGLVTTVARDNSKGKDGPVTGFNLNGFDGTPTSSSETDGPPLNSCPNSAGTWYLSSPAGTPETISTGGTGLEVSRSGITWDPIG